MNYTVYFFSIITAVFLTGCDPGKSLSIKTTGKTTASVIIYADSGMLPGSHSNPNNKVIIRVPSTDTSKDIEKGFAYGIGGWSDRSISLLADHIDSIIISNSNEQVLLKNHAAVKKYLQKNLRGRYRNELIIEAK